MIGSATIDRVDVSAYTVPTDRPESDGTYAWDKSTIVIVHVRAGSRRGMGYTYADVATAQLIHSHLAQHIQGQDALQVPRLWAEMLHSIRNLGKPGISSMAVSAVDVALWDLKAKLLDVALVDLLGTARETIGVYGSGGFTSYTDGQLQEQLGGWAEQGIPRIKMKVGRDPARDLSRVQAARKSIGRHTKLFVDANGAYSRKQALAFADAFAGEGVVWFEEPVSSEDLAGLRLLRDRGPAGMDIAAGEYGYDLNYFRRMLEAEAIDVLQADVTRCGGITGFLQVGPLCAARSLSLSAHCAPSLSAHPMCAIPVARHIEYFHDHVRIEQLFFDGALTPKEGALRPDRSRPGLGLELKEKDAARYKVFPH
jgi:L-alanine-DL-glutamate epimerase-like enolase superfamily enzyme